MILITLLYCLSKRCLPIWIYKWLGKIQWTFITWKRRILHSTKHGRLYICRLHAPKKSLQRILRILSKKFSWVSWFICSTQQYIIVSWCIWKLSEYLSENIWARSCSYSFYFRISIESSLKKAKVKLDLLTYITILLMVEKGIRGVTRHAIYLFRKTNNTSIKKYDKSKEL